MEPVFRKVRPRESSRYILNPHKGFATFQHFEGDPLFEAGGRHCHEEGPLEFPERVYDVAPGYLPTTVAYCRWFWEKVEPEDGRYDFSMVEKALATARERGQTLHVRLMPSGAVKQPWAPKWYLEKYPVQISLRWKEPQPMPVWDSPEYVDKWTRLIGEFGRRFDGDPTLDCVDMAFVGDWGEGQGECSDDAADRITRAYAEAHPLTQRVAMIGGYKMKAGIRSGAGWRCDSCDDLGLWADPKLPFEQRWNHLYDSYPKEVVTCGAQDTWRSAPVVFEPGMTLARSHQLGFDIDFIIRQDLKYHGTVFSAKSYALPEEWMDKLRAFANDLGYRYVLMQARYSARVERGGTVDFTAWVENVGVAPIYYRYRFAVRLSQGRRSVVHVSATDIRTWLPGDAWVVEEIAAPREFEAGRVEVACAIIEPDTGVPRVHFASEGEDADGWLQLGEVEIVR
ncbi:MAG TPA: DUF4832 domain-containing protein [Planctomycetes bacterium]|nr:DUF4832 domain-containing protein [Planctomycetota bacterium]